MLPGAPWLKGATWGVILWAIAQAVVMPAMGMGFFASRTPQPALAVAGSLIVHLVYGGILGAIGGRAAADAEAVNWQRRAAYSGTILMEGARSTRAAGHRAAR